MLNNLYLYGSYSPYQRLKHKHICEHFHLHSFFKNLILIAESRKHKFCPVADLLTEKCLEHIFLLILPWYNELIITCFLLNSFHSVIHQQYYCLLSANVLNWTKNQLKSVLIF